jgi:hypothetical protein
VSDPLTHVIERSGVPRDQVLPRSRELPGFLGINPTLKLRTTEDAR